MSEHRLDEIVIERPRGGMRISAKKLTGYKKNLQKLTEEASEDGLLSPYLIKMGKRTKHFSDHLGPLRRLLRSKVGKPWNDVYSELCQRLNTNSVTGQHVISHLWDFVERYVEIIDGVPYHKTHRSRFAIGHWRDEFYIHPETGILCLAQTAPKKPRKKRKRNDLVVKDSYHQYRLLNNVWYLVTLQEIPPMEKPTDIILQVFIDSYTAWREYGKAVYAVSKRQCNKKEIKFIEQQLAKN